MIWINKHCFNGLYRVNAKGLFNVPFNNRTGGASMDADNLRGIGSYLSSGAVEIREETLQMPSATSGQETLCTWTRPIFR